MSGLTYTQQKVDRMNARIAELEAEVAELRGAAKTDPAPKALSPDDRETPFVPHKSEKAKDVEVEHHTRRR